VPRLVFSSDKTGHETPDIGAMITPRKAMERTELLVHVRYVPVRSRTAMPSSHYRTRRVFLFRYLKLSRLFRDLVLSVRE